MSIKGQSYTAINAIGALLNGTGIANYSNSVGADFGLSQLGSLIKQANASLKELLPPIDQEPGPLQISHSLYNTFKGLGQNTAQGSGAFSGTVPEQFIDLLGDAVLTDRIKEQANRLFGNNLFQFSQTISVASGISFSSKDIFPTTQQGKNTVFGIPNAIQEKNLSSFDSTKFSLGEPIKDSSSMTMNGYNSLVNTDTSLSILGQQLMDLGKSMDITRPQFFANPGQICKTIMFLEVGSLIQLDIALANQGLANVNISELDDNIHNTKCLAALEQISNPESIRIVKELLGVKNQQIKSLADFSEYTKIFPKYSVIAADNLQDFQKLLSKLELGQAVNAEQLGSILLDLEVPQMPTRGNSTQVLDPNLTSIIDSKYNLNGKPIRIGDILGSVAGVGIREPIKQYNKLLDQLYTDGSINSLIAGMQSIIDGCTPTEEGETEITPAEQLPDRFATYTDLLSTFMQGENIIRDQAIVLYKSIAQQIHTELTIEARGFDLFLENRSNDINNAKTIITSLGAYTETEDIAFFKGLAENAIQQGDTTGELVNAAIVEVQNKRKMDSQNIRFLGGVQQT